MRSGDSISGVSLRSAIDRILTIWKEGSSELIENKRLLGIGVLYTAALAAPFYAFGYHRGNLPVIGFCLAMGLGAALVPFLLAMSLKPSGRASIREWGPGVAYTAIAIGLVVSPVIFFLLNGAVELLSKADPNFEAWIANDRPNPLKPLWHIALGSATGAAIASFFVFVWTAVSCGDAERWEAVAAVHEQLELKAYEKEAIQRSFIIVAVAFAAIPVVQILVPVFIAACALGSYNAWRTPPPMTGQKKDPGGSLRRKATSTPRARLS